ncbi:hypothetical protein MMC22_000483 [Lobaria immixta]|nr:hypothetical protein [Lobaria immixta]
MPLPQDAATYAQQKRQAGTDFIPLSSWDNPVSGSAWSRVQNLTFRVLLKPRTRLPDFLDSYSSEIAGKLEVSGFPPHHVIYREAKEFASFLCDLAEMSEQLPRRRASHQMTTRGAVNPAASPKPASHTSSDENDEEIQSLASSTDSMSVDSNERSASQGGSSFGNQSTIDAEKKIEAVTNHLIIDFLRSVSYCANDDDNRPFYLEWAISQDNFTFTVPRMMEDWSTESQTPKNTGPVNTRECVIARLRYAKAQYDVEGKPDYVYAQQVSQIIGMIHQREESSRRLSIDLGAGHRVIPAISLSHYYLYLILATYSAEYCDFLRTGNVSVIPDVSKKQFLTLEEYGPFNLSRPDKFLKAVEIIGALTLYLQESGPLPAHS